MVVECWYTVVLLVCQLGIVGSTDLLGSREVIYNIVPMVSWGYSEFALSETLNDFQLEDRPYIP